MIRSALVLVAMVLTLGVRGEPLFGAESGLLEDFESYPDGFDLSLSAEWPLLNPAFGPGATITSNGGLYPASRQGGEFPQFRPAEYDPLRRDSAVVLAPTPNQNIVLSADIFDDGGVSQAIYVWGAVLSWDHGADQSRATGDAAHRRSLLRPSRTWLARHAGHARLGCV